MTYIKKNIYNNIMKNIKYNRRTNKKNRKTGRKKRRITKSKKKVLNKYKGYIQQVGGEDSDGVYILDYHGLKLIRSMKEFLKVIDLFQDVIDAANAGTLLTTLPTLIDIQLFRNDGIEKEIKKIGIKKEFHVKRFIKLLRKLQHPVFKNDHLSVFSEPGTNIIHVYVEEGNLGFITTKGEYPKIRSIPSYGHDLFGALGEIEFLFGKKPIQYEWTSTGHVPILTSKFKKIKSINLEPNDTVEYDVIKEKLKSRPVLLTIETEDANNIPKDLKRVYELNNAKSITLVTGEDKLGVNSNIEFFKDKHYLAGDYKLIDNTNPDEIKYYTPRENMKYVGKFMKIEAITISDTDGRPMHGKKYTFNNNGKLKVINDYENKTRFLMDEDHYDDNNVFTVPPTEGNLSMLDRLLNEIGLDRSDISHINIIPWIIIDKFIGDILFEIVKNILKNIKLGPLNQYADHLDISFKEEFKSKFTTKFKELFISFMNDINENKEPRISEENIENIENFNNITIDMSLLYI